MSVPLNFSARRVITSDGVSALIRLPGSVDRVVVRDRSNLITAANNEFVSAEWSVGMVNGSAEVRSYTGAAPASAVSLVLSEGISVENTSEFVNDAAIALTAATAAGPVVVSTASTLGLSDGDIVRFFPNAPATGLSQLRGYDFSIGNVVVNTSFELSFMDASGAEFVAATGGTFRKIANKDQFVPSQRLITGMSSNGVSTDVVLSVLSGYSPGQLVTFRVSDMFGDWVRMDGARVQVLAVNSATNTVSVNFDSSAFSAFAFPAVGNPFTAAQLLPFGDASPLVNGFPSTVLEGAVRNDASVEVRFGSAVVGDAGDVLDVFLYNSLVI